ncbi:MAG: hypothetical protein KH378_06555 [Butyrivibrio sp.]|nr:hypothetical protein [Butyrivibrio sp.]
MSKKEELLSEIKKLSSKIGSVKVYFNKHKTGGNNGMGYYFDKKDKLWKSYVCGEYNYITYESENEVAVIEDLYNSVCREAEAHENPLEKIKIIQSKLQSVPVFFNSSSCGAYAIGYFYDPKTKHWATYHNDERGSSLYSYYDCEEEAIVEVYKMVKIEYKLQQH